MATQVRRVVTGHDAGGRSTVTIDEIVTSEFRGAQIWSADQLPADNLAPIDREHKTDLARPAACSFAVTTLPPGHHSPMHRTTSLDYGIILSGALVMIMEDGTRVQLEAGDVFVQRGTLHAFENAGDAPVTVAGIMLAAQPLPDKPVEGVEALLKGARPAAEQGS